MVLLHGKSDQPYKYCQLTICTTHQLLRFKEAFDILVIDEVDVFPFSGSQMLHFAVKQAVKKNSATLYLTATPDSCLLKSIAKNKISVSYLPLRFHGHLLPEIKIVKQKDLGNNISREKLPQKFIHDISQLVSQNKKCLVFVPHIKDLALVKNALQKNQINAKFETVFSADPKRLDKVSKMRNGELDFLITTTILERGVTFYGINVIVLKADDEIFSTSPLVQIAGRVGRSAAQPSGKLDFYVENRTKTLKNAQWQIRHMNQKGRRILKSEMSSL